MSADKCAALACPCGCGKVARYWHVGTCDTEQCGIEDKPTPVNETAVGPADEYRGQVRCIRCGSLDDKHGSIPDDSPSGCGWTVSMVRAAAAGGTE